MNFGGGTTRVPGKPVPTPDHPPTNILMGGGSPGEPRDGA